MIPFGVSRDKAIQRFKTLHESQMVKPIFHNEKHIQQIHKVYVPYCLCNGLVETSITKNIREKIKEDSYENILVNVSLKPLPITNTACESFDLSALTAFDNCDTTDCEFEKQLIISSPVKNRFTTLIESSQKTPLDLSEEEQLETYLKEFCISEYIYLPYWILITNYMDEYYYYIMNGQTGEVYYTLATKNNLAAAIIYGISGLSIVPIYWLVSHLLL